MVRKKELDAIAKYVRRIEQKKEVEQTYADHTKQMGNLSRPTPDMYGSSRPDIEFHFKNGRIKIVEIETGQKDVEQLRGLQNSANRRRNVKFEWFWAEEIN